MARARTIKPGFFTNDLLAECEPLARILFQGLWCHADREGRLAFRPKKLKAEILPYDDAAVEALLSQLSAKGFIQVYESGNVSYIQVVNFSKHQSPHMKEPESIIPAPCENSANAERVEVENASSQALSLNPTPLSLNPTPAPDAVASSPPAREVAERFAAIWREELGGLLEAPRKLTDDRLKACRLRFHSEFERNYELWRGHCRAIRGSPFCIGENDRGWRADFDWALRPKTILRVQEGKYQGKSNGHANGRTDGSGGVSSGQPVQPSGPRTPPPKYILPPH
jgi:hypothetical protein